MFFLCPNSDYRSSVSQVGQHSDSDDGGGGGQNLRSKKNPTAATATNLVPGNGSNGRNGGGNGRRHQRQRATSNSATPSGASAAAAAAPSSSGAGVKSGTHSFTKMTMTIANRTNKIPTSSLLPYRPFSTGPGVAVCLECLAYKKKKARLRDLTSWVQSLAARGEVMQRSLCLF